MTKEQHKIAIEVIEQVDKYFETDCRLKSRKVNVVRPRMYACKIIRELTDMTYQDIADLFGQKHENVMHAIKVVDNDLEVMPKYEMYYLELRAMVETSDVYLDSDLAKKSVMSAIKQDVYNAVYNALMSKDMTELQQILKTIK